MKRLDKSEIEIELLFRKYIDIYGSRYDDIDKEYIINNFFKCLKEDSPDILNQIYYDLKVFKYGELYYDYYIDRINTLYGLNRNIIEVGCGYNPSVSKEISRLQLKLGNGTVTAYDPLLLNTKTDIKNLKLCKESFSEITDVSKFNLMIGIMPCNITEKMIESAAKNNLDLYLAMCGCVHNNSFPFPISPRYYQNYIINYAKALYENSKDKKIEVEFLPLQYDIDYPIIYTKKK